MKIWIVCDNNNEEGILLFDSYGKANDYLSQYSYPQSEDCWIEDLDGTEVH